VSGQDGPRSMWGFFDVVRPFGYPDVLPCRHTSVSHGRVLGGWFQGGVEGDVLRMKHVPTHAYSRYAQGSMLETVDLLV